MSTFQTDTPKPTKTNISADGRENLGKRQISIRRNPTAVSWFFRLRVHAERGMDGYEDAALRRRSTASSTEILAHDLCHGESVLQDLSLTTSPWSCLCSSFISALRREPFCISVAVRALRSTAMIFNQTTWRKAHADSTTGSG